MRLLLDTHAFLWFTLKDPQLSGTASGLILDPNNSVEVSPVCFWELAIKISIGKYTVPGPFEAFISQQLTRN